jgi:hypothetical protein
MEERQWRRGHRSYSRVAQFQFDTVVHAMSTPHSHRCRDARLGSSFRIPGMKPTNAPSYLLHERTNQGSRPSSIAETLTGTHVLTTPRLFCSYVLFAWAAERASE